MGFQFPFQYPSFMENRGFFSMVSHSIYAMNKQICSQCSFLFFILLCALFYGYLGFHKAPRLNQIFPESCLLIVIGVIIGFILRFGTSFYVSPLTPNTFFLYMLPPIILDAGYFMPNRLFFDNLGTILLMAVVGTIFNIATIGKCHIYE